MYSAYRDSYYQVPMNNYLCDIEVLLTVIGWICDRLFRYQILNLKSGINSLK